VGHGPESPVLDPIRDLGRDQAEVGVPPAIGWGLGVRLGLLTTAVVVGVMASISAAQVATDLRHESRRREEQLRASVAPLVTNLSTARDRDDVRRILARFHTSYVFQGYADHTLELVDSTGQTLASAGVDATSRADGRLVAVVQIVNAALPDQPFALIVSQDDSGAQTELNRRWRAWALHVAVTAGVTLALLYVVIRREVTGPIERISLGVRKMERGYWDGMPDPGGARELRWLGWRFRAMGQELSHTVEHLVAAQWRALDAQPGAAEDLDADASGGEAPNPAELELERMRQVSELRAGLERLRATDPRNPDSVALATLMLGQSAAQAERLGQLSLRMEIEDAALRVIDPDGFPALAHRIEAARPRLEAVASEKAAQLRAALGAQHVAVVEVVHRVKHPAGVWKKMQHKSLTLEQVHDLVGLRVLTPTQADCYIALGVVHRVYTPIVGRFKDYIAQPKPNGYRSLHASVRDQHGLVFEVQVRSIAMHRHAERGRASHSDYKDATRLTLAQPAGWHGLLELPARLWRSVWRAHRR